MDYLILSCSLKTTSRSVRLARHAREFLDGQGKTVDWVDLREWQLPFCDAGSAYADEQVDRIKAIVARADGIIVAGPIYNFDINAAAKNVLELTGSGWEHKIVGFLCAAGGQGSYMSIMPFANSLMLDYRSVIVPRYVYATGKAFTEEGIGDPDVKHRVEELAETVVAFTEALRPVLPERGD